MSVRYSCFLFCSLCYLLLTSLPVLACQLPAYTLQAPSLRLCLTKLLEVKSLLSFLFLSILFKSHFGSETWMEEARAWRQQVKFSDTALELIRETISGRNRQNKCPFFIQAPPSNCPSPSFTQMKIIPPSVIQLERTYVTGNSALANYNPSDHKSEVASLHC